MIELFVVLELDINNNITLQLARDNARKTLL